MTYESNQEDPLDEVRAAVRADRLRFERIPLGNLELKAGSNYGASPRRGPGTGVEPISRWPEPPLSPVRQKRAPSAHL